MRIHVNSLNNNVIKRERCPILGSDFLSEGSPNMVILNLIIHKAVCRDTATSVLVHVDAVGVTASDRFRY